MRRTHLWASNEKTLCGRAIDPADNQRSRVPLRITFIAHWEMVNCRLCLRKMVRP